MSTHSDFPLYLDSVNRCRRFGRDQEEDEESTNDITIETIHADLSSPISQLSLGSLEFHPCQWPVEKDWSMIYWTGPWSNRGSTPDSLWFRSETQTKNGCCEEVFWSASVPMYRNAVVRLDRRSSSGGGPSGWIFTMKYPHGIGRVEWAAENGMRLVRGSTAPRNNEWQWIRPELGWSLLSDTKLLLQDPHPNGWSSEDLAWFHDLVRHPVDDDGQWNRGEQVALHCPPPATWSVMMEGLQDQLRKQTPYLELFLSKETASVVIGWKGGAEDGPLPQPVLPVSESLFRRFGFQPHQWCWRRVESASQFRTISTTSCDFSWTLTSPHAVPGLSVCQLTPGPYDQLSTLVHEMNREWNRFSEPFDTPSSNHHQGGGGGGGMTTLLVWFIFGRTKNPKAVMLPQGYWTLAWLIEYMEEFLSPDHIHVEWVVEGCSTGVTIGRFRFWSESQRFDLLWDHLPEGGAERFGFCPRRLSGQSEYLSDSSLVIPLTEGQSWFWRWFQNDCSPPSGGGSHRRHGVSGGHLSCQPESFLPVPMVKTGGGDDSGWTIDFADTEENQPPHHPCTLSVPRTHGFQEGDLVEFTPTAPLTTEGNPKSTVWELWVEKRVNWAGIQIRSPTKSDQRGQFQQADRGQPGMTIWIPNGPPLSSQLQRSVRPTLLGGNYERQLYEWDRGSGPRTINLNGDDFFFDPSLFGS